MAAQLFNEKREYTRIESNRLVSVKLESGHTKRYVAINYSIGGMALHSQSPLPLGEFIDMNFRLNGSEREVLDMTAEVIQNFKAGSTYIIRVKFVGLLPYQTMGREQYPAKFE